MPPQNNPSYQTPPPQYNSAPQSSGTGGNAIAILCYLGILVIVPLLTAKDDAFVKFHAKQGIALIISFIAGFIINFVPFIGWIAGSVALIFNFVMMILGIVNVLGNKEKDLPIIGSIARKLNF